MLDEYKVANIDDATISERINKENLYLGFVQSQVDGFMRFINYTYELVSTLKQKAKISPFIEIRARIKDVDSALKNYSKEKLLDDVFGIEIICATEQEIVTIKSEMEKWLTSTRSKSHDKENGYKAYHESYSIKNENINKNDDWRLGEDDVPVVECQFKTIEVELNPNASHHDYKQVDKKATQEMLENNTLEIGRQIPRMWVSRENGMHKLNYKEIVQRIYPFIDITTIKEPEKTRKGNEH